MAKAILTEPMATQFTDLYTTWSGLSEFKWSPLTVSLAIELHHKVVGYVTVVSSHLGLCNQGKVKCMVQLHIHTYLEIVV